jgi:hypothetical protein
MLPIFWIQKPINYDHFSVNKTNYHLKGDKAYLPRNY